MIAPEKAFTTDFLTEWISKTATPVNVTQILSTRRVTLPILFYLCHLLYGFYMPRRVLLKKENGNFSFITERILTWLNSLTKTKSLPPLFKLLKDATDEEPVTSGVRELKNFGP